MLSDGAGGDAFGHPGIPPRWSRSSKEAVGTAYSTASRVWFTASHGILNEVYFPTIDEPQIRDLGFLITDGETFLHEEKRHLVSRVESLREHTLAYRFINEDPEGRYRIVKEVIADPHLPTVLIRTRLEGKESVLSRLRLFAILAPHLESAGYGNNARKMTVSGKDMLVADRDGVQLALGASVPFLRSSCGFVGSSDGWSDLSENFQLDWQFDQALDGNVAMTAELDLSHGRAFTLALSFGFGRHGATAVLLQSLATPFEEHLARFEEQWNREGTVRHALEGASGDNGRLYQLSRCLLLAHEDKTYPGALVASLSIPWGEARGDDDGLGGYHLVWTRDMCNSAGALLASGDTQTALKALIYLAATQLPDGGFFQNFWIDGDPYWHGVQLDEAAFPIMLAWRMQALHALGEFDPWPMVLKAAGFLVRQSPVTQQERWEECSGYSPSTLAACIAGLICAAQFARLRDDAATAAILEDQADFLESHVERWTVTTRGELLPGTPRHYVRILPASPEQQIPADGPNTGTLSVANSEPGRPSRFPARNVVDAGFLELVRYGVRAPGTPLMEDSLRVVDAVLKVDTPSGPCWHRYNHDGYGQREDGGPFTDWGRGRAWPLLTGERGHYELAAGRDPAPYVRAMEGFASKGGMLPEQIWDVGDLPELELFFGKPTGSAMPLMWAHAEYVKLLRSVRDGVAFDRIPQVADRYLNARGRKDLEIWRFNRRLPLVSPASTLRVMDATAFRLRWTLDDWATATDAQSEFTALGVHTVDIRVNETQRAPVRFTFFWPEANRWEGNDFAVDVAEESDT